MYYVGAMMGITRYFTGIIGARLSAVLTDMVVLGITIWKARTTRVQGVKISVKSTMVYILMRDGTHNSASASSFR